MGDQDEAAMRRAAALGASVLGTTSPNPPVGAVVLDAAGEVVGEGATQPPGGPHAEVVALAQAGERGHTAVVTLEPCDHTGRTGPCTEALLAAGIRRVVIACPEPTAAAGGGADALREGGVEVVSGVLEDEVAGGALRGWLHLQRAGRPFVTWKYAATLDGRSAALDGSSRWITGEPARSDVHRLRAESDAVLVGVGTVLADDPALTARPDPGHQPLRVVVDPNGRTPRAAQVLDDAAPTLIVTHGASYGDDRTLALTATSDGRVDLHVLLAALAERGVVNLLLEGGPTLAGAFVSAGLVDRVIGYVAPVLLGSGTAALQDAGIGTIAEAVRLHLVDVTRVGDDVRVTLEKG